MILDDIVAHKREELRGYKKRRSLEELREMPLFLERPVGLYKTLESWQGRAIIAEVKKASPSKGIIRENFDPVSIARSYETYGAAAISVLTDEKFFLGSLEYLEKIRRQVSVPLLRKDFLFDEYQIYEARAFGASAVLLIVSILEETQLRDLSAVAQQTGMDCLVEVHDEAECDRAVKIGARLIGVNNRDLRTFLTSTRISERLVRYLPDDVFVVSESGLHSVEQLRKLEAEGVGAFLIGETFMTAPDPGASLGGFLG